MNPFDLERDAFGRWVLVMPDGTRHSPVTALRAYPVSAPNEGVALMDADGREIFWIDALAQLTEPLRAQVLQALNEREFLPEILQLTEVSSYATPSTWSVQTDRGATQFLLKGEEDIRRLTGTVLLINDANGVQFMIRDLAAMDKHSRKLLDRFL
jgi:PAS domain-containing protein